MQPNSPQTVYASPIAISSMFPSGALEKVHVRKLAHLINIMCLHNLLVVEQNPSRGITISQSLADKSNVMSMVD